ncbi:hypothetical protein [Epibacterium ulvae]|uniref:hypothetical protein n=1 Tax=Epibacterium ulvae TaxID=1156985 RepID=UPI002490FDDB|nr:hypothetical protein [Epibacterium ulvae]
MRDDRSKWPAVLGRERPSLSGVGIEVHMLDVGRQTVISGALNNCLSICGADIATKGGTEIASDDFYAVRQRRDRILVVNGPALPDGWHVSESVAVSDMSSAYAVLSISGPNAERLIATGTEFVGNMPSPSVSRLWHGFGVLLYRHNQLQTYRMHVRAALVDAVWEMLDRQIVTLTGLSELDTAYT